MSIAAIALSLLVQNYDVVGKQLQEATKPGSVDAQIMESFADLSRGILNCYHRTGRYVQADVLVSPWPRERDYNAERSVVIRIQYSGTTSARYVMDVAVLQKESQIRTAVLADNAVIPYSKRCELERWTSP